MLKFKFFLEKTCVTKKLAYLYTMTNAQNNNIMKFETGKKYYSNKACMAGLSSDMTVLKRNAKTLTIQIGRDIARRTIMVNAEGVELVKRSGRAIHLNVFADNR